MLQNDAIGFTGVGYEFLSALVAPICTWRHLLAVQLLSAQSDQIAFLQCVITV